MYEYKVNILKVVDGDTVDVDIDLGFGCWLRNERVRIVGIDCPESRTSDRIEKVFGEAAKRADRFLWHREFLCNFEFGCSSQLAVCSW